MFLEELFFEIGLILVIAAILSMFIARLRQPLIIAYIITGILVGPGVFHLAKSPEVFNVMSEIGVAFLLFTVGLGLNWRNVKEVGGISLATGVGQVVFTSVVGFVIGQALGFDAITSIYLAVAFTFSSTIIIIKMLMDKDDLDTLYGRISVGFLLVQDFIAMFILLGLDAFSSGAGLSQIVLGTVVKGVLIIPILWFLSAKVVPKLVRYAAKSQELLFVFAIAWCFFIAGLLVATGFGVELGALIAGVTLSGTIYEKEINARVRPLRDFFIIVFFIVLGTHLNIGDIGNAVVPTIIFSLFILIGNPLIVLIIMRSLGYHPRTGFRAGTTVAQISEFSFIVLASGIAVGHISNSILALATSVGLITIAASSYLIAYNEQIYKIIRPLLRPFEPKKIHRHGAKKEKASKVFLFGYHGVGAQLIDSVRDLNEPYTIVDFDPLAIRELSEIGEPIVYGDAGDENFLADIRVDKAKLVISAIPDIVVSLDLIRYLKRKKFRGPIIVSVQTQEEAQKCYKAGATYVIVPKILGGEKVREYLQKSKLTNRSWQSLGKKALKGLT